MKSFLLFIILSSAHLPAGLHDPWDALLGKYVSGGLVDYNGLRNNADEMKALDGYLAALGAADTAVFSRDQQLAFWINAYNAFTVKLILNHFPVKSIRDIKNPWKGEGWTAAGRRLSLDAIEHKILRERFREPRIHFAIVCASIGCPDLDSQAYRAEAIDEHLSNRARLFFSQSKNFRLKPTGGGEIIYLSQILKWFSGDFGKSQEERVEFILKFIDSETGQRIISAGKVKIKYIEYDWSLNSRK